MELVRVPLLNANEDEVEVVAVQVEEGAPVRAGDVLCVVESTKATVDVEAPVSGYIRKLEMRRGMRAKVGQLICAITETATEELELPAETQSAAGGSGRATKKAREVAERHGIDLSSIQKGGLITERDVEAVAGSKPAAPSVRAESRPAGDRVVVYGASGHAKVVIDILREAHKGLRVEAIVDDSPTEKEMFGIPIVGNSSELARLHKEGIGNAVLGI